MSPVGQPELLRLLGSPSPEDRAALLRFAREAPLAYGWWREWKHLYKQAETRPDNELLGALMSRLDAAPFPMSGPAALDANPVKIENVVSLAVDGPRVYAVMGGHGEHSNVRVYDLSDPSAPVEIGSAQAGSGAFALSLQGSRLFVFSSGGWRKPAKVHTFDVSRPGFFARTGVSEVPTPTAMQVNESRLFVLRQNSYSSQEQPGLAILDITAAAQTEPRGFLALENPMALAVSGDLAAVIYVPGYYSAPSKIGFVDISDTAQPRLGPSLEIAGATGIALQGQHAYVTVGENNSHWRRPGENQTRGLRVLHHSAGFLAVVGLQPGLREIAALELGNARSVQVAGRYAYVGLSSHGSHRMKNFRPGGLRIVDIGDPAHPQLMGALDGIDIQSILIVGDKAYVSVGSQSYYSTTAMPRTLRLVDISDPAAPRLIGAPPSRDTFGYMKRRARRTLRSLVRTDPDGFVRLAYEMLTLSGRGQDALDMATQWVSADILFGGTGLATQQSHGRGRPCQTRPGTTARRTRQERAPEAWNRHLDLAAALLVNPSLPWQTQEMALKMLWDCRSALPPAPLPTLARLLHSPSPFLITFAARQAAARLAEGAQMDAAVAADAFFFGNAGLRRQIANALVKKRAPDWWGPEFARRLFQRATTNLRASCLSRRQIGAAVYAASNFPDALSPEALRPVFGLLLAAGREALTAYALVAVSRAAPADALGWLMALADAEPDVQAQAMAALELGLRKQAFDYAAAWALIQAEPGWVREQGWSLLAQSRTDTQTLARVWGDLLDSPQLTPALESAFASPAALSLLQRIGFDGEAMLPRLESRPFLARLLSGAAFSLVAQSLPAAVSLQLIQAMPDEQWHQVQAEFVEALGAGGKLGDFWRAAWNILGGGDEDRLVARLLRDPSVAGSFLAVDDPSFLETTTNPLFDDLLGRWVQAHPDLFARDSALLLAAATHQLPAVRKWALRRVRSVGMRLPFALRLLESELPASAAVGQGYFESSPAGSSEEVEGALALCDSPKASVRTWGCGFVDRRWEFLPTAELLARLTENADPHVQAFLAARLRSLPLPEATSRVGVQQFDRQVLRARNQGRRAKELVKSRRDSLANDSLDTATLLEMARSRTPRDAEWALGQLARLALTGNEIEGMTLDGLAGV